MALTTIPSELSSVSGISDSSSSTAITIDSSQNVTFAGNITTGSNTISGVLSGVTGSIGSAATATTQAASDNSTKLATTAYVTTALANLVDSAPGTLNTLNELAAALGDDANFSTTVTNSIATKLPLAGGTMTGDLILGDNVKLEIGSASGGDLQIFHDGSNSFITDAGTGSLFIRTSIKTQLQNADGTENYAIFNENGAVNLYHDNSVKFETASGGIAIHEDTDKVVRFAGNIGEIGSVTGFQATNTDQSSLVDFGMRATTLRFATGSAERMRIDSNGNIGIGTAGDPAFTTTDFKGIEVQVSGDLFPVVRLERVSGSSKTNQAYQIAVGSSGNYHVRNDTQGTAPFSIATDDTATFSGDLKAKKLTSADGVLELDDNGTHNGIINAPASMRINFDSDNNSTGESFQVGVNATNISGSNILFQVNEDGSVFSVTPGTSSTRYGYNAGNSITSGGNYNVFMGSDAGTAVTTGDSNVAIGFKALFVEDTSGGSVAIGDSALRAQNSSSTSAHNTAVGFSAGTAITTGVQNVYVGALAGDAAQATSDNVGVGYASLSGNVGGQNNVAVGPYALQSFTVSSGNTFNTAVGSQAGSGSSVAGASNTWIGGYAGQYATSADSTVFIGYLAGRNASTGVRNVGIGAASMENGTISGEDNVAVGHNSGNLISDGSNNTVIGAYAGDAINTGSHNVAVGHSALGNLTSAEYNVAIGFQAGDNLQTGHSNVLIGKNVMYNSGTGHAYNVAIGAEALQETSQSAQTAIGFRALRLATSGEHNTAVGYESMEGVVTGSRNSCFGKYAGKDITSGSNNTMIGYSAGQTVSGAAIRNVVIGDSAWYYGSSGDENVIIGTFACGDNTGNHHGLTGSIYIGQEAGNQGVANFVTCVGYQAGYRAYGAENTFIGHRSGYSAAGGTVSAYGCTALGYHSLYRIQTGEGNTCIGTNSGNNITGGTNNVCVGYDAGDQGTDMDRCVLIGRNTNASAAAGANQLVIGHDLTSPGGNNSFAFGKSSSYSYIPFGSNSIATSSDERLKENIQNSTAGLSFINDLRPVTFEWKKAKDIPEDFQAYDADSEERVSTGDGINHGFIAQEVKTVIDNHDEIKDGFDMWKESSDGTQTLSPGSLIPMLVKSIQELSAEVTALKAEVAALKGE